MYRNTFNIHIKRELELIFFDASISYVPTLINHGHTESRARIANAIYMADRSFAIVFVYFFILISILYYIYYSCFDGGVASGEKCSRFPATELGLRIWVSCRVGDAIRSDQLFAKSD